MVFRFLVCKVKYMWTKIRIFLMFSISKFKVELRFYKMYDLTGSLAKVSS